MAVVSVTHCQRVTVDLVAMVAAGEAADLELPLDGEALGQVDPSVVAIVRVRAVIADVDFGPGSGQVVRHLDLRVAIVSRGHL